MTVDRYDFDSIEGMYPHRAGDYVKWEDYDEMYSMLNSELSSFENHQTDLLRRIDELESELYLCQSDLRYAEMELADGRY